MIEHLLASLLGPTRTKVVSSFACVVLVIVSGTATATARIVDRVAAVVDGDVITFSEVEERAAQRRNQDAPKNRLLQSALDELVADKLFDKQIRDLNIEISDNELRLAIDDILKQNRFDTEAQFADALRSQGLELDAYKESMRKQLARMKLMNLKVRSKVKVSDEDVKRKYAEMSAASAGEEEIRVSQLLLTLEPNASAEAVGQAQERAAAIVRSARAGADFASLAKEASENKSKVDGGELGWFRRGELARELDQTAFALQAGQVSDPVRTRLGWHILWVHERRAVQAKPFTDIEDEIRERLYQEDMDRQLQKNLEEMRKQAVIDYRMSELSPARTALQHEN